MNSSFIILLLKKDPGLHNEYIMVKEVEEKLNLIFFENFLRCVMLLRGGRLAQYIDFRFLTCEIDISFQAGMAKNSNCSRNTYFD